ncbi:response regulator [Microcoleus sp. bin38.metabat.b11b12b14.051]|uniref:response regulator n=1 Tax=Microcoleus sp. bin38.metabat.b11b12b14.051 TaxID=2742709 RepID=UPI0025CF03DA|nr:response regulator [Microcoleus sp. bin38.metabat.b11b12b14.051]
MSKPVILCVDDDISVLESIKTQLKSSFGNKYYYELAENAIDALEILKELIEKNIQVMVIVSDSLMPGMKGDELLVCIHEQFPNIVKVMLIGQGQEAAIARVQKEANLDSCLYKPWLQSELIETISSGLKITEYNE